MILKSRVVGAAVAAVEAAAHGRGWDEPALLCHAWWAQHPPAELVRAARGVDVEGAVIMDVLPFAAFGEDPAAALVGIEDGLARGQGECVQVAQDLATPHFVALVAVTEAWADRDPGPIPAGMGVADRLSAVEVRQALAVDAAGRVWARERERGGQPGWRVHGESLAVALPRLHYMEQYVRALAAFTRAVVQHMPQGSADPDAFDVAVPR